MNPFSQPPTFRPCPECGGRRVAGKAARNLHLRAQLDTYQRNLDLRVPALVCTVCGHISFYTEKLADLLQTIQEHPDDFRS